MVGCCSNVWNCSLLPCCWHHAFKGRTARWIEVHQKTISQVRGMLAKSCCWFTRQYFCYSYYGRYESLRWIIYKCFLISRVLKSTWPSSMAWEISSLMEKLQDLNRYRIVIMKLTTVILSCAGDRGVNVSRLPYLLCCLPYLFVNCLPPPAFFLLTWLFAIIKPPYLIISWRM